MIFVLCNTMEEKKTSCLVPTAREEGVKIFYETPASLQLNSAAETLLKRE